MPLLCSGTLSPSAGRCLQEKQAQTRRGSGCPPSPLHKRPLRPEPSAGRSLRGHVFTKQY